MIRVRYMIPFVLTLTLLLAWPLAADRAAEALAGSSSRSLTTEIEGSLVCQCGCGLTVHSCNHLNCPSGIPMKEEIAARLQRGESKEQILGYFSSKYGEKVLAAPTFSGFNVVAWIMPVIVVLVGGGVVSRVARRWARETTKQEEEPSPPSPVDEAYRERLAREIEEFDA